MPLVRIDIARQSDPARSRRIGNIVYESLKSAVGVPDRDNFQILSEHDATHLVHDPEYLGIARSDGIVFIQITLNGGRTTEQKKALYQAIAGRLASDEGVRREDVFISLVEVDRENWSFGNGEAQYAQ